MKNDNENYVKSALYSASVSTLAVPKVDTDALYLGYCHRPNKLIKLL
ncbi:hypothetical protein MYVALT_F_00850 [Candidatus Vallotia tarda]|uniref:Uncharacterized protein n=1 Tax=Candidatus Vallotiella hemipterorum TaxID=1177213 RepID=A0A916JSQ4_9BURK|nr:hypothetical protein MYVALT_F_00850 [Candidatus Vallotia tarda]